MTLRKILSPVDFSEGSREAMRTAAHLAIEHHAELVVCHAWYLPPMTFAGDFSYPAQAVNDMNESAERGLATAIAEARALGVETVSSRLVTGSPWQQIVELAIADTSIDLIIVGTQGRTGLSRLLLGSTAEMVVRHAPCSVLAVPRGAATASPTSALCPIDFSDSSRLALETAFELVAGANASIMAMHVIEPPRSYSEEPVVAEVDPQLVSSAEALLQQWATAARGTRQVRFSVQICVGHPSKEIDAKLADREMFDLVALGSRGRTGIRRLLLGSVAEHTVRHAGRAVLVARLR